MPASMMGPTRIITILSLVALCILSFTVLFGSHNLDTLTRDTMVHDSPFSLPKSNVIHERRVLRQARAASSAPASESNPTPSQSAAATQASSQQFSSPAPSSSSKPSATQENSSSAPSSFRPTSSAPGTSAASSSAPLSSTPAPSSFSSSSARASSSPGTISSTVGATSNVANNPTTTFVNKPVSFTSGLSGTRSIDPGSTVSVGPSSSAGAASGFFGNKAAVGVTFSIVGILGGLAVIMGVLTVMKRRRRGRRGRYAIEDEEFFEKYPSPDFNEPVPHIPPGFGSASAEASIMDVNMNAAPADAYPDRSIHYGQSNAGAVLNPVDYGIAYPPGAAHDDNSTPAYRNGNTHEESGSEYSVPSTSHPYADPANSSGPSTAPPVTIPRPFAGRAQEMVTTDSYYGPNGAGVGAGGMGYAQ